MLRKHRLVELIWKELRNEKQRRNDHHVGRRARQHSRAASWLMVKQQAHICAFTFRPQREKWGHAF